MEMDLHPNRDLSLGRSFPKRLNSFQKPESVGDSIRYTSSSCISLALYATGGLRTMSSVNWHYEITS